MKKIISIFIVIILAFSSVNCFADDSEYTNIAGGAAVSVSATYPGFNAQFVNDGELSTSWLSNYYPNGSNFVRLDFDIPVSMNKIIVKFPGNAHYSRNFEVRASMGDPYTEYDLLHTQDDTDFGGTELLELQPEAGKKYKTLIILTKENDKNLGVSEIQVMSETDLTSMINVAEKKRIVYNGEEALEAPISNLNDGDVNTTAILNNAHADIDLGNMFSLAYCNFITSPSDVGGIREGIHVIASNTKDFSNENDITELANFEETMPAETNVGFELTGKFRYIRIYSDNEGIIPISEFKLYATANLDFSVLEVRDSEDNVLTSLDGELPSEVVIKASIVKNGPYYAVIMLFDENGRNVATKTKKISNKSTAKVDISDFNIDVGYTLRVMLIDNFVNINAVYDKLELKNTDNEELSGFKKSVEITTTNEEYITVIVLKPNDLGITDISGITKDNIKDLVHSMDTLYITPSTEKINFNFRITENDAEGNYKVCVIRTFKDSVSTDNPITVSVASTTEVLTALGNIHSSDTPKDIIKEYVVNQELFSINIEKIDSITDFDKYYKLAQTELFSEGYTNAANIEKVIDYTELFSTMSTGSADAIKSYLSQNISLLPEVKTDYTAEKFSDEMKIKAIEIFVKNRGTLETTTAYSSKLKESIALGICAVGTNEDIESALTKYDVILGIDLTKATDNNISLLEIAKYISGDTKELLAASYDSAISTIIAQNTPPVTPSLPSTPSIPSNPGATVSRPSSNGGNTVTVSGKIEEEKILEPIVEKKEEEKSIFSDIENITWAKEHILKLEKENILSGYNGLFRPNDYITRGEFAKIIVTAFNIKQNLDISPFSDVKKENWYFPHVVAAFAANVITGNGDGTFCPDNNITRQDAAVMINRVIISKITKSGEEKTDFNDLDKISSYAQEAVKNLSSNGIINGYEDNSFRPLGYISRAEAAVMISRAIELFGE